MAKCKYCNANISRLDKEICPFCGGLKPLEGQDDVTEDFTKSFNPIQCQNDVKRKKKVVAAILAITLGVFGCHMFYLNKKNIGFIILASSITLIASIGSILYFSNALHNVFAFLIPYFVLEGLMIISGLWLLFRHDQVDGNGEFLE